MATVAVNMTYEAYQKFVELSAEGVLSADPITSSSWWGFDLPTVLYYFCWIIISIGLIMFFTIGSLSYGPGFMTTSSALYSILFYHIGSYAWYTLGAPNLGGIILSLSILMVTPAVLGWNGMVMDDFLDRSVITIQLELGTIISASYMLYHFPGFPFFVTFIGLAFWGLSMDLFRHMLKLNNESMNATHAKRVTEAFGLLMLTLAWKLETVVQLEHDYSYWLYFWGLTSFWTALTTETGGSNFRKFCYGCFNLGLIYFWTETERTPFLFYGFLGMHIYQGYCAFFDWSCRDGELSLPYRITYNLLIVGMANYLETVNIQAPLIDLSMWMYFHAVVILWWNINSQLLRGNENEGKWFVFFLFNLGYVGCSLYLVRMIFLILGMLGVITYIFHVSYTFFNSSLMFGASLIAMGLGAMTGIHHIQEYFGL